MKGYGPMRAVWQDGDLITELKWVERRRIYWSVFGTRDMVTAENRLSGITATVHTKSL